MSHISTKKTERLLATLIVDICRLSGQGISYIASRLESAGLSSQEIAYHVNGLLRAATAAQQEVQKIEEAKKAAETVEAKGENNATE